VPVFSVGWKDSPKPSMEPGPLGSEMVFGETPDLSAAKHRQRHPKAESQIPITIAAW
jgi:hypothetical protein